MYLFDLVFSGNTHRYTDYPVDITVDGEVYESQVMSLESHRTAGLSSDEPEVVINCSIDTPVINEYITRSTYPYLRMFMYDKDTGEKRATFSGEVHDISVEQHNAKIFCLSIYQIHLTGAFPSFYDNPQDNFDLGDENNGLNIRDYTINSKVLSVTNNQNITVTNIGRVTGPLTTIGRVTFHPIIPTPDQYYRAGVVRNLRTGEVVMITDQVGTNISLLKPFFDIEVNDDIELIAGYDRSIEQATDKFFMRDRHSGTPLVPEGNVNRDGIRIEPTKRVELVVQRTGTGEGGDGQGGIGAPDGGPGNIGGGDRGNEAPGGDARGGTPV